MRDYLGTILRVDATKELIRFKWHDLPPDAEMRGLYWTANSDIGADQVALMNRCITVKIVSDDSKIVASLPLHKIPMVMSEKLKFLSMPPRVFNDRWYGELEFNGLEWRTLRHQAWISVRAIDPSRTMIRLNRTMWS